MDSVRRVLVVDGDEVMREELARRINDTGRMQVVGMAEDGEKAMALLEQLQPELMVLDLFLARKDGLQVLEYARARLPRIDVVVVTRHVTDDVDMELSELGVRYLIRKPCDLNWVIDRLLRVCCVNHPGCVNEFLLKQTLQTACVPIHLQGYPYLLVSTRLSLDKPDLLKGGVTKRLYPEIAKRFDTTPIAVERAIRICVEAAWQRGARELLEQRFGYQADKRPSNREFIAMLVELTKETTRCSACDE